MKVVGIISETVEVDGTRKVTFLNADTKEILSHIFATVEWLAENHPEAIGVPINAKQYRDGELHENVMP